MIAGIADRVTNMGLGCQRFCALIAGFSIASALVCAPTSAASSASSSVRSFSAGIAAQVDATAVTEPTRFGQCIQKSWLQSMEEDTDEVIVYRPEGYPFPPARGRMGFEFLAGEYLISHGFGPADEEVLQHGRWEQPGHSRIAIRIEEPGQPIIEKTWNVVSCSEELLEIAR